MEQPNSNRVTVIKNIYFYLVSFVALMMVVFSLADLINLGLKTWVFTKADDNSYYGGPAASCAVLPATPDGKLSAISQQDCEKQQTEQQRQQKDAALAQKQRDAVRDISMIVVGTPLFILHWTVVRRKEA